jgi:hypothetical protein
MRIVALSLAAALFGCAEVPMAPASSIATPGCSGRRMG